MCNVFMHKNEKTILAQMCFRLIEILQFICDPFEIESTDSFVFQIGNFSSTNNLEFIRCMLFTEIILNMELTHSTSP